MARVRFLDQVPVGFYDTNNGGGTGAGFPYSGSAVITGSLLISGSGLIVTGSINADNITGSLFGTASWARNALTASYALNGGVTQLLAGPNITLSPTNGLGQVTITSNGGGGSNFNTATGSYGSFYDTTTQTNPVADIPRSMSFNTTSITNGVLISGSTSPFNTYIKVINAGVYNIQFSAQIDKTDGGTDDVVIWLRKNGIDLTDTATTLTLPTNNSKVVAAWNWFATAASNDYYQIIWRSLDTDLRLLAEPISSTRPGIPSVILTVNRVDQFLSNTGSFSGSFTGNLLGTASWAQNSLNADFAATAGEADSAQTASFLPVGTYAITASWAQSASNAITSQTASFISTANTNAFVQGGNSFGVATAMLGNNDNNNLAIETNGSTRLFIDKGGNIGIGSGNAASTQTLYIQGSSAESGNVFAVANSTPTTLFTIQNRGNVGIGTANPGVTLDVSGSTRTTTLSITGSNTDTLLRIDSPASSSILFVSGSGNVGIGTNNPTSSLHIVGTTTAQSIVPTANNTYDIGTSPTRFRSIWLQQSVVATNGYLSNLYFGTTNLLIFNSTPTQIGRWFGNGNLLIGSSSIDNGYRLQVIDSGSVSGSVFISGSISQPLLIVSSSAGPALFVSGSGRVGIGTNTPSSTLNVVGTTTLQGASATTGNALVVNNSTPTSLFTIQNNGQFIIGSPTMSIAASQSAFSINHQISASNVIGGQYYGINYTPTFWQTTASQTETAFRIAATFTQSSAAATSGSNIIADFGAVNVGSQLTVTDVTSGSIYMVNDVSGLPIIEATSDWSVNMYNYPNIVFRKTGSSILITGSLNVTGSLNMSPTSSFVLPLTSSASPQTGSAFWSGSFLYVYDGTRYRSSSFA